MSAVIFALLLVATALTMCRGGWKWRIILWKPGSPP